MKVHNFYSDVLLSLSYFLNNITDNTINTFQYNIGSRTFNLDYNPNYNLPAAYVTYNNTMHMNARPSGFLFAFNNCNQIPVLYDHDKDLGLKIQEDMFIVSVDVNLNTDSQLHIINLKHNIETRMPINKYLQLYKFTSYFHLDDSYLNPYLFDATKDKIENLYFKHDRILDQLNYCFSVSYEPLVRLNSVNFNDLEVTAGTYGLNLSFEIMIQLPVKLLFNYNMPSQELAGMEDVKQLFHNNIVIPVLNKVELSSNNIGFTEFTLLYKKKHYNINCKYEKENNLLTGSYNHNLFNFEFESEVDKENITGIVSGLVKNKYIDKGEVNLSVGASEITYGSIYSDVLNGNFKDVVISDDTISGYFSGDFDKSIQDFKIENLDFQQTSKTFDTKFPVCKNNEVEILRHRPIYPNSIYSKIRTISIPRTEVNFKLTKIKTLIFLDNDTNAFISIDVSNLNTKINDFGEFRIENENLIVEGKIEKQSGILDITTINILDIDSNYNLYEIEFDFVFDFYLKRGPGNIEQITIDFNLPHEYISGISPLNIPNFDDKDYTLIIDQLDVIKNDQNRYEFAVTMPYYNKHVINNYTFYTTYNDNVTDETQLEIILDKIKSTPEFSVFSTTESFYYKHLQNVNKIYPIFFSTKLIKK